MINLDDLKSRSAIALLETYQGKNPYIKRLKKEYLKNKKVKLTDNQTNYIVNNHDKEPELINRVVAITPFLGEELQKSEGLSFVPERIKIEFMLAESEKTYHIYGKVKQNQKKSKMYFIPKTQLLDDPYFEEIDVDVDFDKWTRIDKKGRTPYDHQIDGIKFLLSRDGCILADDMGLGKTYQAIMAALESGAERILIVCPSAVKINWEREINDFCDETVIVSGRNWQRDKFTIINYDILKNFHSVKPVKDDDGRIIEFNQEMVNSKFDLCIIDEAHYLKNHKSIRGEIMVDLCVKHNIEKVWLLTGTPIANRPMDFYNLLKLIKAPMVSNWKFYAQRYCDARRFYKTLKNGRKKQIWVTDGASNLDELARKTKNIILRRKKEDVLDMPDKTIIDSHHELNTRGWNEYDGLWDAYLLKRKEEKKRGKPDRDLVELILLRKFIAMEAIPYTIEDAENAINQGHKVIIFTSFTDELNELAEHFGNNCVTHNGPMSDAAKQNSVDQFQNNPNVKVFIGNIRSAGVGITLTAANHVVFNSFDWVPGNNEQAEDRAYRIGQTNNVTVRYQLFDDTISEKMWYSVRQKKNIIGQILGEEPLTDDEIEQKIIDATIVNNDES